MDPSIGPNTGHSIETLASELLDIHHVLETKIRRSLMCGRNEARLGFAETLKFLSLVARHADLTLTPAHRVDLVWHEFILFTRLYGDFCQEQFGKFIHHTPSGTHKENRDQFETTLQLYQTRFGSPPLLFWGGADQKIASCGNCESIGT
ncbi:MAG TPA: hypothetical protein DDZ51_21490 [Planctomycetaceae bacterium]|nr:hypothetical protein [Planctomycetaceae bacterium]